MPFKTLINNRTPIASINHHSPPSFPATSSSQIVRRRSPLLSALCIISISTIVAVSYRVGGALAQRRVQTARALHSYSKEMDASASLNTVPSIVVYVTVPNKDAGKKLSESIITEKLAACVNRVPGIESVYWWDGKVQSDSEELLIIKTRESLFEALTEHVKSNHEYEVPEVIALPIIDGNLKYLEWIKSNTREN